MGSWLAIRVGEPIEEVWDGPGSTVLTMKWAVIRCWCLGRDIAIFLQLHGEWDIGYFSIYCSGCPRPSPPLWSVGPDHIGVIHYALGPHIYSNIPLTLPWLAWQPFWPVTSWSHLACKVCLFIACWLFCDQPVKMKAFCSLGTLRTACGNDTVSHLRVPESWTVVL